MIELGRDVARIEIDDDGLHLQHIGGAGLSLLRDRAGDDIDRRPLALRPRGEGRELVGRGGVGLDPDVVRSAVLALTLVDEATDRDQPLALAEHDVDEDGDLLGIGLAAKGFSDGGPSLKSCHGLKWMMLSSLMPASLQQRSAMGRNGIRRSRAWWRRAAASSPASVACRIRTPRSDMRCARSASKGTSSWCSSAVSLLIAVNTAGAALMPGTRGFHVGLIDRDLRGIDGLRLGHAVLDAGAPVLGVHRLAFPECGNDQTEAFGALRR